jgi:hypothetical protein
VLQDERLRTEYDVNIAEAELLSKIAANTYVKRSCSKAVSLLVTSVEARDFVSVDFVTKVRQNIANCFSFRNLTEHL